MGLFGIQQLWCSIMARSNARAEKPVQSVACFCAAVTWIFFTVSDGSTVYLKTLPPCVPEAAIIANCVLFSITTVVSLLGWAESGSVLPNFGALLSPKGEVSTAMLVSMGNLVPFGIGCAFFCEDFLELFAPGVMGSLENNEVTTAMVLLIMRNMGKIMLINVFTCLACCSVGDALDTYRLLRTGCFIQMFYIGGLARENVLATATEWNFQMYVPTVVSCVGAGFYACSAVSAVKVALVEDPKKSK